MFENKLAAALSGTLLEAPKDGKFASLARPFLEAIAAPTATPGGGSVSALAGALAASLGQMVAGLSRKKKSQAAYVDQLSAELDAMRRAVDELAEAIDRDAASYDAVLAAIKLPQGTAEETQLREAAIQAATKTACGCPAPSGRADRCPFRTPGTTGGYRRRIHEVRLGSSARHGRGGVARCAGQR